MDNSFFKLDEDDSVDADNSFLNLSGTSRRGGSDFSFYDGDTSLFSGEESPSPLFMTPGPPASQTPAKRKKTEEKKTPAETSFSPIMTPGPPASQASAKRKKIEEKMTPSASETSFSPNSSAPGDESQLFPDAIQTPAKKINSSFSSSAPTPRIQVETMKEMEQQPLFTDITAPATPTTPPAPERKEMKEMKDGQDKKIPPNLKEMMEAKMKDMLDSLMDLESFQVQGGNQLLAKADSVEEEVSTYKEELANIKESYQNRINLAASFLNPK